MAHRNVYLDIIGNFCLQECEESESEKSEAVTCLQLLRNGEILSNLNVYQSGLTETKNGNFCWADNPPF